MNPKTTKTIAYVFCACSLLVFLFSKWQKHQVEHKSIVRNIHCANRISALIEGYKSKFSRLPGLEMRPSDILTAVGQHVYVDGENKITDQWEHEYKIFYGLDSYLVVSSGPNGLFDFANGDDVVVSYKK